MNLENIKRLMSLERKYLELHYLSLYYVSVGSDEAKKILETYIVKQEIKGHNVSKN